MAVYKAWFFFFYPLSCQSIFLDLFFPRFTLHHLICTLWITNQSTNRRKKKIDSILSNKNSQNWGIEIGSSFVNCVNEATLWDLFGFSLRVSCGSCCWSCCWSFTPPGNLWVLYLEKKQSWWGTADFSTNCMYSYNKRVLENIFIFIILNHSSIFQGSSLLTVRKQQIDLVFSFWETTQWRHLAQQVNSDGLSLEQQCAHICMCVCVYICVVMMH